VLPGIVNLRFDVSFSVPVVIIIEPSLEVWEQAYGKVYEVLDVIYGRLEKIYFLGNKTPYFVPTPREFRDRAPVWFGENRDRVNLIGPILEQLEKAQFRGMLLVFCAALPVDLEDWDPSDLRQRIRFVRTVGDASRSPDREMAMDAPPAFIVEGLDNPVKRLAIKGEGFVPLRVDFAPKGKAELHYSDGAFELVLPFREGRFQCHLQGLCKQSPPLLHIEREKGPVAAMEGTQEPPWFDEPRWEKIPEPVRPVLEAGIAKSDFVCPQCRRPHGHDTVLCPEGDVILQGMPRNTPMIFRKWDYLALYELFAYPLQGGERIITSQGKIYDWKEREWRFAGDVSSYAEVDHAVWGLFIRV